MNRTTLPTEEEQYQAYKHVVKTMAPLPVTIRTLDIGGDKLIPHLNRYPETNPQLGWRSIRFCLDRPDIFKAQLRALYRASVHGEMQIMFPMISGVDEMRAAMKAVNEVKADLAARKVKFNPGVPVGAMLEVPGAIMAAERLADECAFFSIGTNDLIQYTLAVDRANDRIADLYDPCHPGVLALLREAKRAADKAGIPCTICGEMAGDAMLAEVLLGLGFTRLSMSPVSLTRVRAEIAKTNLSKAKHFAQKVLRSGSCTAVRSMVQQRYESRASTQRHRER
jgi:phosphotransferase system enzyme I (PtsI)